MIYAITCVNNLFIHYTFILLLQIYNVYIHITKKKLNLTLITPKRNIFIMAKFVIKSNEFEYPLFVIIFI